MKSSIIEERKVVMPWQLVVLARVVSTHIVLPVFIKLNTTGGSRTRKFFWQYAFCAMLTLPISLVIEGAQLFNKTYLLTMLVGFINSFGAYCSWRAYDISVGKTAVFTQMDDLIGVGLAYVFLNETRYLGSWLGIGVVLCLVAGLMMFRLRSVGNSKLFVWILGYSLIWGATYPLIRAMAVQEVPPAVFLGGWYSGTFFGGIMVCALGGKDQYGPPLTAKQQWLVFPQAVLIVLALGLQYWSKMLAPLTVVQPIYQFTEMFFPLLVGLIIFKERKTLNRNEWIALSLGVVGSLTIIFSF